MASILDRIPVGYVLMPVGWFPLVTKARGHKYIRRIPIVGKDGKKRYRYIYKVTGGKGLVGHEDELIQGSAFRYKEGHYHVTGRSGGMVTVRHDETGKVSKMPVESLKRLIRREHSVAIHNAEQHVKRQWRKYLAIGKTHMVRRYERMARQYGFRLEDFFPSGSNHAGEIRGFTGADMNVGVSALHVNEQSMKEIESLSGQRSRVFVDSGAFEEVQFNFPRENKRNRKGKLPRPDLKEGDTYLPHPDQPIGPFYPKPFNDEHWDRVFRVYNRTADALGANAVLVAPDKVADQGGTLSRLAKYADRVKSLRDGKGAQIIMPIQKGGMSMAEMHRQCEDIIGKDFIAGIPLKKDATTIPQLEEYLAEVKPERIHLLGLGTTSKNYPAIQEVVNRVSPETTVTLDAVRITALVGRQGGTKPLTAAQDQVAIDQAPERWGATDDEFGVKLDYTEAISQPDYWMSPLQRNTFAKFMKQTCPEFTKQDEKAVKSKPEKEEFGEWLQTPISEGDERLWYEHPMVEMGLNAAWAQYHQKATTATRKKRAIQRLTPQQRGDVGQARRLERE